MRFAIEFFTEGSEGRRDLLDRMAISFESVDRAEAFAVTIAKNIKMSDRVADLCGIMAHPPKNYSPAGLTFRAWKTLMSCSS